MPLKLVISDEFCVFKMHSKVRFVISFRFCITYLFPVFNFEFSHSLSFVPPSFHLSLSGKIRDFPREIHYPIDEKCSFRQTNLNKVSAKK